MTMPRPGACDRRRALALALAGGVALAAIMPGGRSGAAIVAEKDARLDASYVEATLAGGAVLRGYHVRPAGGAARLPGVVLVHNGAGLTAQVRDLARRLALEGFLVFAPDLLTASGGTPPDAVAARAAVARLRPSLVAAQVAGAARWLMRERRTTGSVGIVGLGWGGAAVNRVVALAGNGVRAGVTYYGAAPDAAQAARVTAPLLLHFAGHDPAVNRSGEVWVRALQKAGRTVIAHFYPGTAHGFADDAALAHDPPADRLAWERTVAFLQRELA